MPTIICSNPREWWARLAPLPTLGTSLHRPDFDHVGYEMLQQILDAVLQRRRRDGQPAQEPFMLR